jgi:hypothetical protein
VSGLQRWVLHAAFLAVALSGVVYGLLKYLGEALSRRIPSAFPLSDDPFTVFRHPVQPWALDLHVVAAPILIFALGWIFRDHILAKAAAKGAPLKRSGALALLATAPLVLSGYLLQTLTNESLHLGAVILHVGSGGLFALAYGAHAVVSLVRGSPKNGGAARDTSQEIR